MPRTIAIGDVHGCAIALAKLTALDVDSGQVWQVNERGEVRG